MKRFCAKLLALGLTVSSVLGGIYTALPMTIAYATEVTDNTESGDATTGGDTATEGNTTTENENQTEAGTVTVEARISTNKICFTGIDGATGYEVYRSNSQTEGFTKINTDTITSSGDPNEFIYYDTSAGTGTQFWYKIEATKDDGSTVTVGTAQDIYVTGLDAVHKHAQTGQYHRDFVEEGNVNFDGSRVEVGTQEEVNKIKDLRDGTILISYKPSTYVNNSRKALLFVASEGTVFPTAAGQGSTISAGQGASLFQEVSSGSSFVRADFGSSFRGNYTNSAPVNQWATLAIVCDVDKVLIDKKTISAYNGAENTAFDNSAITGFFNHLTNLTRLSVGGVKSDNTTVAAFQGKIAYITVTDEILTQAEINEYTKAVNDALVDAENTPVAPTDLNATPGDSEVTLTWTAVAENVTGYEIFCSKDNQWVSAGTETSYTVSGLENNTAYTFKVRAVNNTLTGAESDEVTATPKASVTAPVAPENLTATPGDTQVVVSWDEVEGATSYQVCVNDGEWETIENNTSHTFTQLTNDTEYTFKVRAVNEAGEGVEASIKATPTADETPAPELPAIPTGLTTTPGDKQVTLSWTAVEGATSYEVCVDEEAWITVEGGTEYTFTDLTNDQEYTFKVRAVNDAGAGEEASTTATPTAEPPVPATLAAPARFEAQAGDGEVTLSWNEVEGDVTRYEVSMDGGTQWVTADSSTGHTFTGLTNGTEYTFKVRAVNDNGNGAAATTKATPVAQVILPSAPENFTAVAGDGQVTLSWDEVEGEIIRYEVSMNNGTRWVQASSNTSHTFTGLINGRTYTFKVRAISSEGSGEASTTTATPVEEVVPTAPAAPTNFKAQAGDSQVSLSWTEVAGDVTRYEVSSDGGKTWTQADSTTSHTFTGLTNGTEYTFKVRAVNDVGNGAEATATATPEEPVIPTAPEAPTNFKATPGNRWVKLTWTESEGEVTRYEVSKDGGKTWTKASSKTGHMFASLMNGQEYTFKVRAVNDVGRSPEATATATPQEIVLPDPLTAPEDFAAEAGDGEVTLSWKELEGEVPRYEVSKDGGRTWVEADSTTSHTFTGLKNGTQYTFKVRGVNDAGNGEEARTTATPKAEVVSPDAPKAPTFSPEPETYKSSINVGIESETKGAVIYYTIDGSKPTNMSKRYTSPITITKTTTIKAIAYKNNVASEVAIGEFEINTSVAVKRVSAPVFSPVAGTYNKDMYVQITTPTEGADIYYTVDGTDPTTDSLKYTGPIWINRRMPFRAIAVKQGMDSSKIVRAPYLMDRKFPFTDIEQNNQWKHECVKYVWDNSIMNGIAGTTLFEPDSPLTRAMFATVLYRMAGEPDVNFAATFSDVEAEKWYSDAIIWANQKGIVQGLGDGSYGINHNITREQIAKMLYEYAKGIGYDISETQELSSFTDEAEVSPWAVDYMKWATAVKMITGKPNDDGKTYRMDPKGEATRAECAAMLMRFENKYIPYE